MKFTQLTHKTLLAGVILSISWGCQQDEQVVPEMDTPEPANQIVLGKQLQNPYTLDNMSQALTNLMELAPEGSRMASEIDIRVTHKYLRILPRDHQEELRLETDTSFSLTDFPLHFEISETGDYYHDPAIPDSLPTWKYTTVPVDFSFADSLEIEILEEMYFPRVDIVNDFPEGDTIAQEEVFENTDLTLIVLQHEAFSITENEDGIVVEIDSSNLEGGRISGLFKKWIFPPHWNAGGVIRVWNTVTGVYEPVVNVEVKVWKLYESFTRWTNSAGRVDFGRPFRYDANYTIEFKNENFAIKEGWLNSAEIRLLSVDREFEYNFGGSTSWNNNKNWFHATVHNAANLYYTTLCGQYSIQKPNKTTLRARIGDEASNYNWTRDLFGSEIHIYDRFEDMNADKSTNFMYGSVFHELTHASHFKLEPGIFQIDDEIWRHGEKTLMIESWALGVEIVLVSDLFGTNHRSFGQLARYQRGGEAALDGYSSLICDLIDIPNSMAGTDDQVNGYNLDQIENALNESRSWDTWERRLYSQVTGNPTREFLGELFNSFSVQ